MNIYYLKNQKKEQTLFIVEKNKDLYAFFH